METLTVPLCWLPHAVALGTPLPAYQTVDAAGMDLHAAVPEPVTLPPLEVVLIPCGFAVAVPRGYEAQIRPRSGLAVKHGVSMPNSPGTIDADYRGEVQVPLIVLGREPFVVEPGMRIAQMLVTPVPRVAWDVVEALPGSGRGGGGFGSTGVVEARVVEARRGAASHGTRRTRWHITFGTYGSRLHGDTRPTVDRRHNVFGTPFLAPDAVRVRYEREQMSVPPLLLTDAQRLCVESALPEICDAMDASLVVAAAPEERNHVHVVVDTDPAFHGKQTRALIKRRLTQRLNADFHCPAPRWWAKGGSTKAVKDEAYQRNVYAYVSKQRFKRDA